MEDASEVSRSAGSNDIGEEESTDSSTTMVRAAGDIFGR